MLPPWPKFQARRRLSRRVLLMVVVAALFTGCDTVSYYKQAAAGQYEIIAKREPIRAVLARTNTPPALREKLQLVLGLREFAERELHLKADGHYAKYADLGRRYVVWNVYAAPEFSLEPKKWWYPVVGSLKYRGFFAEQDARDYGAQLAKQGFDVYVGGVDAYSTLGWFKDPVLNTFIHHTPANLAETLFHELAHQRVFASGDTDFNEAFATCVGEEGARRWLAAQGDAKARADYEKELRCEEQFVALVMRTREELKRVFGEDSPGTSSHQAASAPPDESLTAAQRTRKAEVLAKLRAGYETLKAGWGGYAGYDKWFQRPLNNAHLNTVATYQHFVPAFQQLLASHDGHLEKFYTEARALAALPRAKRDARMAALEKMSNHAVASGTR